MAENILLRKEPYDQLYVDVPIDYRAVVSEWPETYIYKHVEKRMLQDEALIRETMAAIDPYAFGGKIEEISQEKVNETDPYWGNTYFTGCDARVAYGIVAAYRPKKIVEIGSGNSTKFMRRAARDYGLNVSMTSIDPHPRTEIDELCDRTLRFSVLLADPSFFTQLEANDILFLDGSHVTFNGTDTTHFFLEILPVVKPGVIIHVHDIFLPHEYGKAFDHRGYSEQYMLAASLLYTDRFQVMMPNTYATRRMGWRGNGGVSFWFRVRP